MTVFNWLRDRRRWIHLIWFILFSILIHGSGFYLFQVVYPSPLRVEPEGDAVELLDPNDPEVRVLLKRIQDRSVYLFPPSRDAGVRMQLEDSQIRFTPSFQSTDLQPLPLQYEWSLPPKVTVATDFSDYGEPESRITVSRKGDLRQRAIAPWSIMKGYLDRAEWLPDMQISLQVDQDGLATVSRIEGELEENDRDDLKRVIESTLRFLPGNEKTDGVIEIRSKIRVKPGENTDTLEP